MKKKLLLLASLVSLSSVCVYADSNPNQQRIDEIESQIKESKEELKELKKPKKPKKEKKKTELPTIGDTVEIDRVEITINSIEFTDERNQFEKEEPEAVIRIDYTLKNNRDEDLYYSGHDFKVYVDGKETTSYPNENSVGGLSSTRSIDCTAHHTVEGDGEIEIEWTPTSYRGKDKAIFRIDRSDIK